MSVNKTNIKDTSKKSRPLGVWALTIFGLVFGGIYPLSFEPLDLLMGYTAFYGTKDILIIKIMALLNVAIIITSILAWKGSRIGQLLFLIFITILFGWGGIVSSSWGSRIPRLSDVQSWLMYIVEFGFPVFCVWYFNKPSTKEFYGKVEKMVR
ncbi:MAG: hypothetical protein CVU44_09465 [Chloroflexi bacterium HGW-Chloroflexi-6]|nr:MAG: hypothetical protein CVU44_09465 [Chloroflexi bacterium HGW-Chloroflexi-6]